MPNWAEGTFKIRGSKENIIKFLKNELSGSVYPVFGKDELGNPTFENKHRKISIKENGYSFSLKCEDGFYINNTRRAFIESESICFYSDDEEFEKLEIGGFKQAWGVIPSDYVTMSKKYDLDFKIFAFETGMEFTQEIEIIKGKVTKDIGKKNFDDYFWDVPFSELGG